jgi:hypothetical protein
MKSTMLRDLLVIACSCQTTTAFCCLAQKTAEIRFCGNHGIGILENLLPSPGQQLIQRIHDALPFRLQGLNKLPQLLVGYRDNF